MKLTTFILLAALMQVSAASFGQRLNLKGDGLTIDKVFREIRKQTGYGLVFQRDNVNTERRINADFTNAPLEQVMEQVLKGTGMDYSIGQKTIVITKAEKSLLDKIIDRFLAIEVRGKVLGEGAEPLAGATVKVKSTGRTVATDQQGNFSLSGVEENELISVSYVGYQTLDLPARAQMNFQLKMMSADLEQVTINKGYYTETKRLGTGTVEKISAGDISSQPVNNPLLAMAGRMAGVYVEQSNGVPGSGVSVRIRGTNSIRPLGNAPLYLVDGVPYPTTGLNSGIGNLILRGGNALAGIGANDIQSIEVLKDADATAIYGSRGANGVVLITTKKGGGQGKPVFQANVSQGIGQVGNFMDMLNTQQYLMMRREAFKNDNATPSATVDHDLLTWDTTRYTNWQKELIGGTAHFTNAGINLSGGSQQTSYSVASGYARETTVFPGDFADQKYSTRFTLGHRSSNSKLQLDFSGSYIVDDNRLLYTDLTSRVFLSPNTPAIYNAEGKLNWQNGTWQNPYALLLQRYTNLTKTFQTNGSAGYELVKGLRLKANFGFTDMAQQERQLNPITSISPFAATQTGFVNIGQNGAQTWITEPQLSYEMKLGPGKLGALVGTTFQQTKRNSYLIKGDGYTSDALLENIQAAPVITASNVLASVYRYSAIFGRLNYAIEDKYILNLTGRRDGSSRFGPGKQFANFGALGASWLLSSEGFMKSFAPVLSFAKLKFSYGITGNDQIGDYGYYDLWEPGNRAYGGVTALLPSLLFNADYGWEETRKLEGGIDLGLFGDRISLGANYYRNHSSNQLVGYPLSLVTGFASIQSNMPAKIRNTGLELQLNASKLTTGAFQWSTSVNFSRLRNRLIAYPGIETSTYANILAVGRSLQVFKAIHYLGVDATTGLYTFQDVNGNGLGSDNPADLQAIKERSQDYFGGWQNSFRFKGIELDVLLQFVKQQGTSYFPAMQTPPGALSNQLSLVLDRWQRAGDQTSVQRYTQRTGDAYNAYSFFNGSDATIGDASFVRLKNVSLSYLLPEKTSSKLGLRSAKIYVQGQNLLTITGYKGLDPENQNISSLPPLRVVSAGIQLSF